MSQLIPDGFYLIYSASLTSDDNPVRRRVNLPASGKFNVVPDAVPVPMSQRIEVKAVRGQQNRYTFTVPSVDGSNKARNCARVTDGPTAIEGGHSSDSYLIVEGVHPNHQFHIRLDQVNEWSINEAGNIVLDEIDNQDNHLWTFVVLPN